MKVVNEEPSVGSKRKHKDEGKGETYAWACTTCSEKHRRCDGKRPCGYCTKIGAPAEACIDGEKRTIGRPKKKRTDGEHGDGPTTTKKSGKGRKGRAKKAPGSDLTSVPYSAPMHPQVAGKRPPDMEKVMKFMEDVKKEVEEEEQKYKRLRHSDSFSSLGGEEEPSEDIVKNVKHENTNFAGGEEEDQEERTRHQFRPYHNYLPHQRNNYVGEPQFGGGLSLHEARGIRELLLRLESEVGMLKRSMMEMEQGHSMLHMKLEQLKERQDILAANMGQNIPPLNFNNNNTFPATSYPSDIFERASGACSDPPSPGGPPSSPFPQQQPQPQPQGGQQFRLLDSPNWPSYSDYFSGNCALMGSGAPSPSTSIMSSLITSPPPPLLGDFKPS